MTRWLLIALAALGAAAAPAAAETPLKAVVELFTSQGCSSCPPADARLAELARRPDVVALTLPVDYWDYLGWKDTLARPEFSARQRAYSHGRGDRAVFTPQMVVNGALACIGSDGGAVDRTLDQAAGEGSALPVQVRARLEGGSVRIEIEGSEATPSGVWLLPVLRSRDVAIGRGENRGRAVTYVNVVRGVLRVGEWSGGSMKLDAALPPGEEADAYVVLVQAMRGTKPARILGAAKVGAF
ncbi:DUF1223 domain-containing protein [Salinarimonas soli]|nr:DUF1223 domain-containing protein [Salinarimonas soli]